ncbi:MAG: cyclic nucleotide-binding domain-containing protein [archaeon]|nr:cyclic nucleotide-binding domain-containing protein [archaeon]
MLNFLQDKCGYTTSGLTIDEKKELEDLRKQITDYREREKKQEIVRRLSKGEIKPSDIISPPPPKAPETQNKINKIETKDEIKEEENESKSEIKSESFISEGEENDVMDEEEELKISKAIKAPTKVNRCSVSAESFASVNSLKYTPKVVPKSPETINNIKSRLVSLFFFSNLDSKDLQIVIDAMEEVKFEGEQNVIVQGETGDVLYIVDKGKLECFKTDKTGNKIFLRNYDEGDFFGELALLYNCPRGANIRSKTDVLLYSLDRLTFNMIVKKAAIEKREKYEGFLKNVPILSNIDQYELTQVCDSMKVGNFTKGDYIIKEGETGDVFYILEEGSCDAVKQKEPGKPPEVLKSYSNPGDYFGERALITGEKRFASMTATSDNVKVICIDRFSFERLLGPAMDIMKRNMDSYNEYNKKIEEEQKQNNILPPSLPIIPLSEAIQEEKKEEEFSLPPINISPAENQTEEEKKSFEEQNLRLNIPCIVQPSVEESNTLTEEIKESKDQINTDQQYESNNKSSVIPSSEPYKSDDLPKIEEENKTEVLADILSSEQPNKEEEKKETESNPPLIDLNSNNPPVNDINSNNASNPPLVDFNSISNPPVIDNTSNQNTVSLVISDSNANTNKPNDDQLPMFEEMVEFNSKFPEPD